MSPAPAAVPRAPREPAPGSKRGTYLFVADAFHPRELPPEAKTNTLVATALAERGWQVVVWAGAGATAPPAARGLTVARTVSAWGRGELLRLVGWIAWHRPARIGLAYFGAAYSMRPHINWLPVAARTLRIPCTTLFTNGEPPNRDARQDALVRRLGLAHTLGAPVGPLGASSRLLFYSDADRIRLLDGADPGRFEHEIVTPPSFLAPPAGAPRERRASDAPAARPAFRVGYFGLVYPLKGLNWLLRGVRLLRDRGCPAKLVLVGGSGAVTADLEWNQTCRDHELELRQLARELDLEADVEWCGYRSEAEAAQLLLDCDAVCLPFDDGVTGLRSSFVECALLGVPVVTTLTERTDGYLREADSGILFVEPQNPAQIADCLERLATDPKLRRESAAKLARFAAKRFRNTSLVDAFDARPLAAAV